MAMRVETIKKQLGYGAQSDIAVFLGCSVAHVFYVIGFKDKRTGRVIRREDARVEQEIARRLGRSMAEVFGASTPTGASR